MISIVTPWLNNPLLIPGYERATDDAQIVIVDSGSTPDVVMHLEDMLYRNGTPGSAVMLSLRTDKFSFANACNAGLTQAGGDVILMLNNDVTAEPGWLSAVERDTVPGALVGPATGIRVVAGQPILYVEGWCVAARRETWDALGGFDAETFQRPYWEDVDLSWRAAQMGIRLLRRPWAVTHIGGGNTTSRTTPGAYDASETNRQAFERKVRAAMVPA